MTKIKYVPSLNPYKILKYYRTLTFDNKTKFTTFYSIIFNLCLCVFKILFAIIFNMNLVIISGFMNLFIGISKYESFKGIKTNKASRNKHYFKVTLLFIISGIVYNMYMARLFKPNYEIYNYDMFQGIIIALVSFIELGVCIYGIVKVKGSTQYFRIIKSINFASSLQALVLTEIAIMKFTDTTNNLVHGFSAMFVGTVIILMGIILLILPYVSITDRVTNDFTYKVSKDMTITKLKENGIEINDNKFEYIITKNKVYGIYKYIGILEDEKVIGKVVYERCFFKNLNIFLKVLVIILSEILLFVWLIGRMILFIKNINLNHTFNKKMATLDLICN